MLQHGPKITGYAPYAHRCIIRPRIYPSFFQAIQAVNLNDETRRLRRRHIHFYLLIFLPIESPCTLEDLEPLIMKWWDALEKEEEDLKKKFWGGAEPRLLLNAVEEIQKTCINHIDQLLKLTPDTGEGHVVVWET